MQDQVTHKNLGDIICKIVIMLWLCITSIPIGITYQTIIKFILIAVLAMDAIIKKRTLSKYASWSMLFLIYCFISVLWSYDLAATWRYLRMIIMNFALLNMIVIYADKKDNIIYIIKCYITSCIILSIYTIAVTNPYSWGTERIGENTGYLANVLGISLAFGLNWLAYFQSEKKALLNIIIGSMFLVLLVFTGSRVPLFLALFGLALQYIFSSKSKSKIIISMIISGIILFSLLFLCENNPFLYKLIGWRIEGLYNTIIGSGKIETSARERMYLNEYAYTLFIRKPFLGYGLGNFRSLNNLGLYAHNNILELLTGIGIFGTTIYYWMYFWILRKLLLALHDRNIRFFLAFLLIAVISEFGVVTYDYLPYQLLIALCFAYTQFYNKNNNVMINKNNRLLNNIIKKQL